MEEEVKELKERIAEQERKLVEQEHRFLKVLQNFFINRKRWPKGDKRRVAAFKALLYSMFFSPTTVAATGGAVALISVIILFQQTEEIKNQNKLIQNSNVEQHDQFVNQRITELTEILYDDSFDLKSSRLKSVALIEYAELHRQLYPKRLVDLRQAQLMGVDLYNCNLDSVNLRNANLEGSTLIGVSMKNSVLDYCNFQRSNIKSCNFYNSDIIHVEFGESLGEFEHDSQVFGIMGNAKECNFNNCNLQGSSFDRWNIENCSFKKASVNELSIHLTSFQGEPFTMGQFGRTIGVPRGYPLTEEQMNQIIEQFGYCRRYDGIGIMKDGDTYRGIIDTCFAKERFYELLNF